MCVLIKQGKSGRWALTVNDMNGVIKVWTFRTLIDALNLACALQLHVNNISELPLNQYGVIKCVA